MCHLVHSSTSPASCCCLTLPPPPPHPLQVALAHIRDNREAIDRITEALVEKETLTGQEFRTMLAQYVTIPEENLAAAQAQAKKVAVAAFTDIEL